MAITFTREALKTISSSMKAEPLNHNLWRLLSNLRISRFQPRRRGKRAGQRKQRPLSVATGRRDLRNSAFSSISISKSNEGSHLHIPSQNLLNIQLNTSSAGKTSNTETKARFTLQNFFGTARVKLARVPKKRVRLIKFAV